MRITFQYLPDERAAGLRLASAGRYFTMAISLLATLILARLLAPQEYGVTVVEVRCSRC